MESNINHLIGSGGGALSEHWREHPVEPTAAGSREQDPCPGRDAEQAREGTEEREVMGKVAGREKKGGARKHRRVRCDLSSNL